VLGKALLTEEELRTVLTEAERCVNDRPLTAVCDDKRDVVICPSDFIVKVEPPVFDVGQPFSRALVERRAHKDRVANELWKRFREAYLHQLVSYKARNLQTGRKPEIGDVVLVDPENRVPRSFWPLGKIVSFLVSRDEFPRVAQVLVAGKVIRRPTSKLFFLEASDG
jgi:hypothetical protein